MLVEYSKCSASPGTRNRVDRVGGHGGFGKPLQDQFQFAGIGNDVADREHAGDIGLARRGIDTQMVALQIETPAGDRPQIHRQTEKRQQHVRGQMARAAVQIGDLDAAEHAVRAMQRVQLIGDDQLHRARRRRRFQLRRHLGCGAEFGPAMHDLDAGRDAGERQRPVHGRVPAAGDHHALAAEILAPAHVVLHGAGGLVGVQPVQRRAVGAEGTGAGGDDDGARADGVVAVGAQSEGAGPALQRDDAAVEQAWCREGGDLLLELRHQSAGFDGRVGGDVVDRLFRVEGRALAADLAECVDQHAGQLEHAALEHGEKPGRACADDGHVCLDHAGWCTGCQLLRPGASCEARGRVKPGSLEPASREEAERAPCQYVRVAPPRPYKWGCGASGPSGSRAEP